MGRPLSPFTSRANPHPLHPDTIPLSKSWRVEAALFLLPIEQLGLSLAARRALIRSLKGCWAIKLPHPLIWVARDSSQGLWFPFLAFFYRDSDEHGNQAETE